MGNVIQTQIGKVVISQEVIGRISGRAAMQCYGLVGMSRKKFIDGVTELVGREALRKGVTVKLADDYLVIDLYIVVSYGVNISEVANLVKEQVKYAVESLTGLIVEEVNVMVQGVRVTE